MVSVFSHAELYIYTKEMLYEVRCLKSNEDMILALVFELLCSKCEDHIFIIYIYIYGTIVPSLLPLAQKNAQKEKNNWLENGL